MYYTGHYRRIYWFIDTWGFPRMRYVLALRTDSVVEYGSPGHWRFDTDEAYSIPTNNGGGRGIRHVILSFKIRNQFCFVGGQNEPATKKPA